MLATTDSVMSSPAPTTPSGVLVTAPRSAVHVPPGHPSRDAALGAEGPDRLAPAETTVTLAGVKSMASLGVASPGGSRTCTVKVTGSPRTTLPPPTWVPSTAEVAPPYRSLGSPLATVRASSARASDLPPTPPASLAAVS